MRRYALVAGLLALVLVVSLAGSLFGRTPTVTAPASLPEVSTTLFPLYDIVRNVVGETVEVSLILPPGASPHTFEPRPSDVRDVDESVVVYAFGHGIDSWSEVIAASTGTPIVIVDQGIALRSFTEPDHDGEEEEEETHGDIDPHYWLNAHNGAVIARTVAADLSSRFPEHASIFAANAERYATELEALDIDLHTLLSHAPNPNLITLHDAWGYFAAEYGLKIAGSFEPAPGKEPTPSWLQRLADAAKKAGVRTIYAEPQLSRQGLEAFAADHNLRIVTIDPEGSGGTDSYIDLLRRNAQAIRDNQ